MGVKVDLVGQKFGKLVVLKFHGMSQDKMTRLWHCKCECGGAILVPTKRLNNGDTKSCGCLSPEVTATRNTSHGCSDTALYRIWRSMLNRCHSPANEAFPRYGGRGITVDPRWHTFENFKKDMGTKPKGMSLERLENNLGYSATNCKWATYTEQNSNRRDNVYLTMPTGDRVTLAEAARRLGVATGSVTYGISRKGSYKGVTPWHTEK